MKEYLYILLGVCAVSGIVRVAAPEGELKKYIEIVCSLCVIAAVAVPLVGVITGLDDIDVKQAFDEQAKTPNYEEIYKSYLVEGKVSAAADELSLRLAEHLSVPSGSIRLSFEYQHEESVDIQSVTVYIGKEALAADPDRIKEYIKNTLGAECEIIYNIND